VCVLDIEEEEGDDNVDGVAKDVLLFGGEADR
jgi:hypothetical protein